MIKLEKFDTTHYNNLISWIDNKEDLMQFAGPILSFPLTTEQLEESFRDPNRYAFCIIDINTQKDIGHCELYLKENTIHLGRILIGDKNFRGKGIGKQIVSLLLSFGFTNFDKPIAELNVFDWNKPAIKSYIANGFMASSGERAIVKMDGKIWTTVHMTISKTEWSKRQNLEKA